MPTNQQKFDSQYNNICGDSQLAFLDLAAQRKLDMKIDKIGGGTTTERGELAWAAQNFKNIPTAVLNQNFTLADGTVTNLAGILATINTKAAALTGTAPAPTAPAVGLSPADIAAVATAVADELDRRARTRLGAQA